MSDDNGLIDVSKVLRTLFEDAFYKMPVSMRLMYFLNALGQLENHDNVDWAKLNDMVLDKTSDYDFNNFFEITNYKELAEATANANASGLGVGYWWVGTCCDCSSEFFMEYEEVMFFKEKGFKMPKRCKSCRSKRKANGNL